MSPLGCCVLLLSICFAHTEVLDRCVKCLETAIVPSFLQPFDERCALGLSPLVGPASFLPHDIQCCATQFGDRVAECEAASCKENFGGFEYSCVNHGVPEMQQNQTWDAPESMQQRSCPYHAADRAICDVSDYLLQNRGMNCREGSKGNCLGKVKCNTNGVVVIDGQLSNGTARAASGGGPCAFASWGFGAGEDCFYNGATEHWKVCSSTNQKRRLLLAASSSKPTVTPKKVQTGKPNSKPTLRRPTNASSPEGEPLNALPWWWPVLLHHPSGTRKPSTRKPSKIPTVRPSRKPRLSKAPTLAKTRKPSKQPTARPSRVPTRLPTARPSRPTSPVSSQSPTQTHAPTRIPTTAIPTVIPTTAIPTRTPNANPTTASPTTANPTTANPTTVSPITVNPTTANPTTANPTTAKPTTANPTTANPTTKNPTTANPTTANPTTTNPTTANPTTANPTTANPTTANPTTTNPTTAYPTTANPTTANPTTANPTTASPTTANPTASPTTANPTTANPTTANPTTANPTTTTPFGFTGSNYATKAAPLAIVAGDFNNDGHLDIVVGERDFAGACPGGFGGYISRFQGTGTGTLNPVVSFCRPGTIDDLAAGDFNIDGNLDLVSITAGVTRVDVSSGDGAGNFVAPSQLIPITGSGASVAVGDLNKDGKLDAVAFSMADVLSVELGNGAGLGGATAVSVGSGGGNSFEHIALGDFDGDTFLDVAVPSNAGSVVDILLGDGLGGFGAPTTFGVDTGPQGVAVGDFDGNGALDFATYNELHDTVSIFLGVGDGTFGIPSNLPTNRPKGIVVADIDGDGHTDIATTNFLANTVTVFLGVGDGTFGAPFVFPTGSGPQVLISGDLNGDGKLDLFTTCVYSASVTVLLQN